MPQAVPSETLPKGGGSVVLVAESSRFITPMGESGPGNLSACLSTLDGIWRTSGLLEKTIKHRLRVFVAVGGDQATPESISVYLRGIPKLSTRRERLSSLRCCFRALVFAGLMSSDPTVAMPRVKAPRWAPRPLTVEEAARLLQAEDPELQQWFTFGLFAGLRASEIAVVEAEQLELWDAGWTLRVVGKGSVEAVIPAHPKVIEILKDRSGRLYPEATGNAVTQRARYWMSKQGIKGGIHRTRHTFATRALAASSGDLLVVRDLLRHASVSTTQVYAQLPAGKPFEVMAKL